MSILIRFASTHFPDDTNLEIYAEGRDSAGQTGSASRYVLVYNKATLYGRTVFYVHTHGDVGVFASDSDELTGVALEAKGIHRRYLIVPALRMRCTSVRKRYGLTLPTARYWADCC